MSTSILLAAQAADGGIGGILSSPLVMIILLFVIMWFFMIRPQQKKQKEIKKFQDALAPGARVVTGGGVHGEVKKVDLVEGTIDIEIAKGVVIKVDKAYVFAEPQPIQK